MPTSYPYASPGSIVRALQQFRKNFPASVNASTLKKFSIAPNNESYVISVLRFLGFLDEDGNRVDSATEFFYGDESAFESGLEKNLRESYKGLFDDFADTTWEKSKDELVPWFRATDKSSDNVGARQSNTFLALASLAGHGDVPVSASNASAPTKPKPKSKPSAAANASPSRAPSQSVEIPLNPPAGARTEPPIGLTVRVEINLPANGDESTYDAIFRSIRRNLIEGQDD